MFITQIKNVILNTVDFITSDRIVNNRKEVWKRLEKNYRKDSKRITEKDSKRITEKDSKRIEKEYEKSEKISKRILEKR